MTLCILELWVSCTKFGESLCEKMSGGKESIQWLETFCSVFWGFFLLCTSTLKSVENGKFSRNQPEDFHFDFIIQWIQSWITRVCFFFFRTQVRRGSPEVTLQQTGSGQSHVSRTVKRYPSSTAPITSNALPIANGHNHGHTHTQHVTYSNGQPHTSSNTVTPTG